MCVPGCMEGGVVADAGEINNNRAESIFDYVFYHVLSGRFRTDTTS